jgi:hypothetical protein
MFLSWEKIRIVGFLDSRASRQEIFRMSEKPVCKVDMDGSKGWYLNDVLHREDGPAVEWPNGTKKWYIDGLPHRADGPAVVHPNGTVEWWLNGKMHREDGPALERANGDKGWAWDGMRHRLDGPAYVAANGEIIWYIFDEDRTTDVEAWLEEKSMTLPFNEDDQKLFNEKFGN